MMEFNDSQKVAIDHFMGPALVVAGPGSGKTAVLTNRIASLINKGVSSKEIIVITFTKAAALEMMERFERLTGDNSHSVAFGTFHSFFYRILRDEFGLKSEHLLTGSKKQALVHEAYFQAVPNKEDDSEEAIEMISKEISYIKNTGISFEEYETKSYPKQIIFDVMNNYETMKVKYGLIDFDDMLTKTYELFISNNDVLEKWQKAFRFYLVDEAQDMNKLQYEIIRMLCAQENNLFMVGDDDQSIYGFRGANPEIMLGFENDYPGCTKIVLDINYRCGSEIINVAKNLIENNAGRFDKDIKANQQGGIVKLANCEDSRTQAKYIVDKVNEIISSGNNPNEIAVLYRNHKYARTIVEQFIEHKIPFYLKDGMPNIYSHFIMEDMETFFEIAIGNSTRSRMARIMNRPNHYFLRQSIEQNYSFAGMKDFYRDNLTMLRRVEALERDFELISKMSPYAAATYIRKGINYEEYLRTESLARGYDYEDMCEVLDHFTNMVKDCKNLRKAIEKLQYLRLQVDYKNKNTAKATTGVGLFSLHSSKGLEFDTVFITDVNENVIPTKRAVSQAQVQEERRLFYVGITRAKNRLYVCNCANKNRERMYPSRFINELYSTSS